MHFRIWIYIHSIKSAYLNLTSWPHHLFHSVLYSLIFGSSLNISCYNLLTDFTTCKEGRNALKTSAKWLPRGRSDAPDVTINEEAPFEELRGFLKGGKGLFLKNHKTTEVSINHRWRAVVTPFHHTECLLSNQRQVPHVMTLKWRNSGEKVLQEKKGLPWRTVLIITSRWWKTEEIL